MNVPFRISPEDQIELGSLSYRLQSQNEKGLILRQVDAPDIHVSYQFDEFRELLASGAARLRRRALTQERAASRLLMQHEYLSLLPQKQREKVLWQEQYCCVFLRYLAERKVTRNHRRIAEVLPQMHAEVSEFTSQGRDCGRKKRADGVTTLFNRPSPSTLLRWVRAFENGGCEIASLFPKVRATGKGDRRLSVEIEALISMAISEYLTDQRITKALVYENVRDLIMQRNIERLAQGKDPLRTPALRTVRNRIAALDPFSVYASRHSLAAARKKYCFYETGTGAQEPLERVEIDEWKVDLITLLVSTGMLNELTKEQISKIGRGRRWLYVAIDCATRCIMGMRIAETPNYKDAIRTLEDVTRDKTDLARAAGCESTWDQHGSIVEVVADQGAAFKSEQFRAAARDIGASRANPGGGMPWLRGADERVNGTFSTALTPLLSGRTFLSPKERGDYNSVANSALTDDDLIQALIVFVVDVYHNRPHSALFGETPANCWRRLAEQTPPYAPPDLATRLAAFGEEMERVVAGNGVTILGISYNCEALRQFHLHNHAHKVKVRIDPENLGHASVCIDDTWHIVDPLLPNLEGVSVSEWRCVIAKIRHRNATQTKLSEAIVWRGLSKIRAINDCAMKLARLSPRKVSASDIERTERELVIGLTVERDAEILETRSTGIFEETIPTGPGKLPLGSSDASSQSQNIKQDQRHSSVTFEED